VYILNRIAEYDIMCPLGDATHLATDIYRPKGPSPSPVLLHRTPYGKSNARVVNGLIFHPLEAVDRGFIVAVQDVRGTGNSDGKFNALVQERQDGHDAINWLADQPWCNGSVGMYGSSYMGATTLQAAIDAPESLKAVFTYLTGSNYFDGWTYSGGAFELAFNVRWTLARVAEQLGRTDASSASAIRAKSLLVRFDADAQGFFKENFDVRGLLEPAREFAPYFFDWLDHSTYDDYWRAIDVASAAPRINVPILHVAGWYDGFLNGHLALQRELDQSVGRSPARHRLVIGPWSHEAYLANETACSAGQRYFGPDARGGPAGVGELALRWFSTWLDGGPDIDLPPVRYFLMGENTWCDAASWPPPHSPQLWYLRSAGHANTRSGDGRLSLQSPQAHEPVDTFDYDPHDPCPTVGGRHLGHPLFAAGVQDQTQIEDRNDVLVYTTRPLGDAITIAGPIRVTLFVQTSAPTTDFFAALVDVDQADAAANVADGVLRLAPPELPDGAVQVIEIDLLHTAYTFWKGHRMRLHITSSCFPRLDRNLGSSVPPSEVKIAKQRIVHNQFHASALILPIPMRAR
jgi:putative CocE/NonD family hydrolase